MSHKGPADHKLVVYAFIDGQNLHLGVLNDVINKNGKRLYAGKSIDYRKFRSYLRHKYGVSKAYIFLGKVPDHKHLYKKLTNAGFKIVFKKVLWYYDPNQKLVVKGNVDTDIVLYSSAKLINRYDKAIFISGDGDFLSLYDYIEKQGKLSLIFVPNRYRYSRLLNKHRLKIRFVSDLANILMPTKKTRSGGRSKP